MADSKKPLGGKWNYDHDNRKPATADLFGTPPLRFAPDAATLLVLTMVAARFFNNFGKLLPFGWATDRAGALQALDHFVTHALPTFGDYQDAMLMADPVLSHSLLSPYLNIGLLSPLEVCQRVEAAWQGS